MAEESRGKNIDRVKGEGEYEGWKKGPEVDHTSESTRRKVHKLRKK